MGNVAIDSYDKLYVRNENIAAPTTFLDSALTPKTITANGNAKQLPAKFNKSAGFFNGTSDYVKIPTSSDFDFGTGDFTIEGNLFWNDTPDTTRVFWDSGTNVSKGCSINIAPNASNYIGVYINGTLKATFNTVNLTINAWNHVAVTRSTSDGKLHCWINGTQIGTGVTDATSFTANTGAALGSYQDTPSTFWNGWMKEVRISNSARYTANFTPSTTQYTSDSSTKLLLHFDTPADCPIAPAIYFDGTGDYLSIADHADWDSGASGSLTYEAFVQFNATGAQRLFSRDDGGAGNGLSLHYDGAGQILGYIATANVAGSWTPVVNKWYHIALVRNSSTVKVYVDGVEKATGTIATAMAYATTLYIGQMFNSTQLLTGYMREIRVSNVARYTTAFTPSQTGFTVDANTKLYIKGNEANGVTTFVDSETTPKTVTTNGDTKIKWTEDYRSCIFKDDGNTGHKPYPAGLAKVDFFAMSTGVGYFDGTNSYLSLPSDADYGFGTGDLTEEFYVRWKTVGNQNLINGDYAGNKGLTIFLDTGNSIGVYSNGVSKAAAAFVPVANTWYYILVSRSGTSLKIFINGTDSTTSGGTDSTNITQSTLVVGSYSTTWFNGLMDNIRIAKGVARYTATFDPPFDDADAAAALATTDFFRFF